MSHGHRTRLVQGLLLGLALAICGALFGASGLAQRLDLLLYDAVHGVAAPDFDPHILVVAIDEPSLDALGGWPWSRQRHAELLDRLDQAGARAVALDVLFAESQASDLQGDLAFARSLAANARTALPVAPVDRGEGGIGELLPLPALAEGAAALGHVDVEVDRDGLARRVYLQAGLGEPRWPALALALAQIGGETDVPTITAVTGPMGLGWVRSRPVLIPFSKAQPTRLSYADVLAGHHDPLLRDAYVLVGATAAGLGDNLATPGAAAHERMPGVVLNAHLLNGVLKGALITTLPEGLRLLLLLTTLAGVGLALPWLSPRLGIALLPMAALALALLSTALLGLTARWFAPAAGILALLLALPLWGAWVLTAEQRLRLRLLQRLEHLANHHVSTGLPDQDLLERRLRELTGTDPAFAARHALMIAHVTWPGSASSILARPIARDTLRDVARRLHTAVGPKAFVAHLSGDDFAILSPLSDREGEVAQAGARVLQALREPLYQDHRELRLAPRLGISVYPDDAREPDALLRSAYTAVFKSRIDGTEPLCLYSAELGQAVAVRSELEQALAQALDRDEFIIHYQPQVSASTGAVVGLEALLRWRNPRLGWVEPEAFIPVAEHMGLIQALGAWTLEAACRQLHAWELVGFGPLRLSVNLSPLQFGAVDLVTEISAAVERSGIAPSSLELEITESTLMRDIAAAARAMNSLRSRGVAVAIDDFGTGYSSLASLRDFPLDRLKIDRAFVREIGSNRDATEIALAVIAMGKRLGLQVVAEGVERAAQARFLELNGCDELQGYYFSRPLPPEDFEALLRVGVGWTPTPSRRP